MRFKIGDIIIKKDQDDQMYDHIDRNLFSYEIRSLGNWLFSPTLASRHGIYNEYTLKEIENKFILLSESKVNSRMNTLNEVSKNTHKLRLIQGGK